MYSYGKDNGLEKDGRITVYTKLASLFKAGGVFLPKGQLETQEAAWRSAFTTRSPWPQKTSDRIVLPIAVFIFSLVPTLQLPLP